MNGLDSMAVTEHGLVFRYVPAGTFLMGSERGEPDESPVHEVHTDEFWITDVPVTWAAYCAIMGFANPPDGSPPASYVWPDDPENAHDYETEFLVREADKVRRQYCETETETAYDHHTHTQHPEWKKMFGEPPRTNPAAPWTFDQKPMVAITPREPAYLLERLAALTAPGIRYSLPTEAEWEKAARGGLVGKRYAWGDEPPTKERCDFDRFGDFRLRSSRALPPNGYGLYAMCGGVWEHTSSSYDALAYRDPKPKGGDSIVLRGGSWCDCAEAVTVSFRASLRRRGLETASPNVGFRLVRR